MHERSCFTAFMHLKLGIHCEDEIHEGNLMFLLVTWRLVDSALLYTIIIRGLMIDFLEMK